MEPGVEDAIVSVLFEFKGSKKELILSVSSICERVQEELMCLGVPEAVVAPYDQLPPGEGFILQRWIAKWNSFVNVQSVYEIKDEDRLTVVRKPRVCSESPTKVGIQ